jgi:hypothetical protein
VVERQRRRADLEHARKHNHHRTPDSRLAIPLGRSVPGSHVPHRAAFDARSNATA